LRGIVVVDAGGTARQHDAVGLETLDRLERHVERVDLAVNVLLADAARDQLRVLGAEVEDEDHDSSR
jgi:hypothetical protein